MRIVLEGISGAGKSVQARRLKRRLQEAASVEIVSEFSRGSIGRAIRSCYALQREPFVRFHGDDSFADQTHLLLLGDTIAKAEEMSRSAADLLLVDRLFDSWLCYTLTAQNRRALGDAAVRDLYRNCSREHVSGDAVTVFLELDTLTALKRLALRDGFDFKESAQLRLEAVAQQFVELYAGSSTIKVDAARPPSEVTAAILEAVGLSIPKGKSRRQA
jgi:thymidylate kinase